MLLNWVDSSIDNVVGDVDRVNDAKTGEKNVLTTYIKSHNWTLTTIEFTCILLSYKSILILRLLQWYNVTYGGECQLLKIPPQCPAPRLPPLQHGIPYIF